jgi:hypothetical protein
MFPFKWLHPYIPVLPKNQYEYLESPTPYIMGVLSSNLDFQYLKETYPNHIICDANTSMIYGSPYCCLPVNEEIKLRRKLQYIKHPEIYEIEEFNENIVSHIDDSIEDISSKRNFSENAQYIFFAMLKNALADVKKLYITDGVFESQKFLENITNEELRDFWEKLINTISFEYFILSYQYLDDSNTKVFKNICKNENDEEKILNRQGLYEYNINLPNMMNLFSELEYKANTLSNVKHRNMTNYIEKIKTYNQNYNQVMGEQKTSIYTQTNSLKRFPKTQKKEDIHRTRRNHFSYDFSNKRFLDNSIDNTIINSSKISSNFQHYKNISSSHFDTINEKKNISFKVYGKTGYLYFCQEMLSILTKKEISQLGYQQDIISEINNNNFCGNKFENSKILELISENSPNSSLDYNSNNKVGFDKVTSCILDLPKSESFQYYLIQAFYLGEYSDNKDKIYGLYNKAGELDKRSFPCVRFFQFLDEFNDIQKIRSFLSTASCKLIAKIISYKIKLKQKYRTVNYNEFRSKPNIFEEDKEEDEKKFNRRQSSRKITVVREDENNIKFPSFKADRMSMIDGIDTNIVLFFNLD